MNKFLFFNLKKDKIFNILIFLMVFLWIIVFNQMINILTFEKNYSNNYRENMPIDNGVFLRLNTQDILSEKELKENKDNLTSFINENKINYFTANRIPIPGSIFNIDAKKYKSFFKSENLARPDFINYVQVNYGYLDYLGIDYLEKEKWNKDNENIPILMGDNYKKDYKIGDKIKVDKYTLEVNGFLERGEMYIDGPSPINYSEIFDDAIVGPINLKEDIINYLVIYSDEIPLLELQNSANVLFNKFNPKTFDIHLQEFLSNIDKENSLLKLTFIFITILNLIIINSIILLKIIKNKKNIGIYYSVGGNNRLIFKMIIKEFFLIVIFSTLLAIPVTYKLSLMSVFFFVNNNRIKNIILAIFLLYFCIGIITFISLKFINKLTTKDLIGGFRE